jgi:hypothetical protein
LKYKRVARVIVQKDPQEKQQTTLPDKLEQLKTSTEYTDEKINKLVFELYGLGEEDRRIVEGV